MVSSSSPSPRLFPPSFFPRAWRTSQQLFGLRAERLQFFLVLRLQVLVRLGPLHSSIKAVPALQRITEFGMAHGHEDQVKGVELSLSGMEAVFERGNGLSIKSVA